MQRELELDWLVCPVTKEKLRLSEGKLKSSSREYRNDGGFWNFIPENLAELDGPLWKVWDQLQANGVSSYVNSPTNNLGVGPRRDFMQFAEFCNFNGLVLDIGVGPQKAPTHIEYTDKKGVHFVGLDPLSGHQPRDFSFVQGLGEYLPFRDGLFDQALFVTSLDHFIDPVAALVEAKRVIKPEGTICVWIGEKDKNAPKPTTSPDWYKALQIPEGAEDPFHYRRFTLNDFMGFLEKAKLAVKDEQIHVVDQWRKNCFYKLVK